MEVSDGEERKKRKNKRGKGEKEEEREIHHRLILGRRPPGDGVVTA